MRKELSDKIIMILTKYLNGPDLQDVSMKLAMVLDSYEISKRSTEIIKYEGDKNRQALDRFLAAKIAKGCTKRTIKFYSASISHSLAYIGKNYDEVTADDIRVYIANRIYRDGVSKTTANNEKRSLSSFYTWLQVEEILLKNPMAKVDAIKYTKTKKNAFTPMEVETMRVHLRTTREKAMFEFLLSTWARITETVNVRISDIDGDKVLVHGKGEKDRYVFLNARAKVALQRYLDDRKDENPYLFPRAKYAGNLVMMSKGKARKNEAEWYKIPDMVDESRPMVASSAESIVRKIGKRAGVEKVHPHRFRRTGATMALRSGMPIVQVSKTLGHENIATTQIYLDISDEELMDAHNKYVN